MCSISSIYISATTAPRLGTSSISPSPASDLNASRNGVRDTCSRSHRWRSLSLTPGEITPSVMIFLIQAATSPTSDLRSIGIGLIAEFRTRWLIAVHCMRETRRPSGGIIRCINRLLGQMPAASAEIYIAFRILYPYRRTIIRKRG